MRADFAGAATVAAVFAAVFAAAFFAAFFAAAFFAAVFFATALAGAAFLAAVFLATVFFAAVFFAAVFFAAVFFAAVFFAAVFFAAVFFAAVFFAAAFFATAFFATAFFATAFLATVFPAVFFAAVFFAVFFTAAFFAVRDVLRESFVAVRRPVVALRALPLLFRAVDFFAVLLVLPVPDADFRAVVPRAVPALVDLRAVLFEAVDFEVPRFAEREAPALREAVRAVRLSVFFAVPVLRPFFAAILTSLEGVQRRHRSAAPFALTFVLPSCRSVVPK